MVCLPERDWSPRTQLWRYSKSAFLLQMFFFLSSSMELFISDLIMFFNLTSHDPPYLSYGEVIERVHRRKPLSYLLGETEVKRFLKGCHPSLQQLSIDVQKPLHTYLCQCSSALICSCLATSVLRNNNKTLQSS